MGAVRSKPRFCNRALGVQCRRARSLIRRAGTGWQAYETWSRSHPGRLRCAGRVDGLGRERRRSRRPDGFGADREPPCRHRPQRHGAERNRADLHRPDHHGGPDHDAEGDHARHHHPAGHDAFDRNDAGPGAAPEDPVARAERHKDTQRYVGLGANGSGRHDLGIGGTVRVVRPRGCAADGGSSSVHRWTRGSLTTVRPGIETRNVSERVDG
jgi:hypothetical protein